MARRRPGLRKRLALNIFSDLYASTVAEHRLTTLFWECTLRCNLSCRHCGSDCRVDPGVPDMPLEDFLKVLDEEITPHVDHSEVLIIFSGGEVLVRGKRAPVVGRLCMDQMLVDVTDVGQVSMGDAVTVIGRDGPEEIRAEELAARCGTITNELLAGLSPRLGLVYEGA